MIYPFIAAVIDAVDRITVKRVFNVFRQISPRMLAWWIFVWVTIFGLMFSPWLVQIEHAAFTPHYLVLIVLMTFLAANYNYLYYYGLRNEQLANVEPFFLFNPLVTILIASLFYPDERSWQLYSAVIIAAGLLAWSHIKKHHISLGKPILAVLGFSLLFGLEAVVIKQLLVVYSPVALYLVRVITTALFIWILEKGRIPMITLKQLPYFVFLGAGALAVNSLIYTSYKLSGISDTIFVIILSPILVYALSVIFLKEKLLWKNVVASVAIVLLVVWVIFFS
ncbi:DMT family transporter [Patescibacteria group bacterium]|nr:DMT family transporter [Patescibacteria group bacterium]